jgi:hypothetical protein
MVSPQQSRVDMPLSRQSDSTMVGSVPSGMFPLSDLVGQYVEVIERQRFQQHSGNQPTVAVSESLGLLAFAYEKLRNSVEYREDHLLLRNAIKRILKRRLNPLWKQDSIGASLLRELIWARYLKNDSVPQSKISEVETLLRQYAVLRKAAETLPDSEGWQDWILGIAACDIEAVLLPRVDRYALAEIMYRWMMNNVVVDGLLMIDRPVQLYVAVHRALLKSDRTSLTYHLFLLNAGEWQTTDLHRAEKLVHRLPELRQTIEAQLNHPMAQDLVRATKRYTPPFLILDDITRQQPGMARAHLTNPVVLKRRVEELCQVRYLGMRSRVKTAIVRSMIYIFITKMFLALLLEVPYDLYFFQQIHWITLATNVLFPPLLMVAIGSSIRTPTATNTDAIYERLTAIVSGKRVAEVVLVGRKTGSLSPGWSMVYLGISLSSFALVGWLLHLADFTIMGIGLFLLFFCIVLFFAYRIRQIATEMSVVRTRENPLESILTFFTLPFLRLGYRLSASFGKMNIFVFILDVLLEAPFKLILDLGERWLDFSREKRDELVESNDY